MKYAIISINDRAKDNIENTKKILCNYEELNIRCVDGHKESIEDIMLDLSVHKNNWQWAKPRNGEIGLWLTNIFTFKKMVEENIDMLLLLEDDAMISEDFVDMFEKIIHEVPKDFDFVSLQYPKSSRFHYKDDAEIGLEHVCLAKYNHFGTMSVLWSKSGAEKMLSSVKNTGFTYPIDLYMHEYLTKEGLINGYSIKPFVNQVVFHDWNKYRSTIDLDGTRGGLEV
jgi:GR25 family glycosyltransferase involved in LPS biosynthesis